MYRHEQDVLSNPVIDPSYGVVAQLESFFDGMNRACAMCLSNAEKLLSFLFAAKDLDWIDV